MEGHAVKVRKEGDTWLLEVTEGKGKPASIKPEEYKPRRSRKNANLYFYDKAYMQAGARDAAQLRADGVACRYLKSTKYNCWILEIQQ
jgi:hypothetical protein